MKCKCGNKCDSGRCWDCYLKDMKYKTEKEEGDTTKKCFRCSKECTGYLCMECRKSKKASGSVSRANARLKRKHSEFDEK